MLNNLPTELLIRIAYEVRSKDEIKTFLSINKRCFNLLSDHSFLKEIIRFKNPSIDIDTMMYLLRCEVQKQLANSGPGDYAIGKGLFQKEFDKWKSTVSQTDRFFYEKYFNENVNHKNDLFVDSMIRARKEARFKYKSLSKNVVLNVRISSRLKPETITTMFLCQIIEDISYSSPGDYVNKRGMYQSEFHRMAGYSHFTRLYNVLRSELDLENHRDLRRLLDASSNVINTLRESNRWCCSESTESLSVCTESTFTSKLQHLYNVVFLKVSIIDFKRERDKVLSTIQKEFSMPQASIEMKSQVIHAASESESQSLRIQTKRELFQRVENFITIIKEYDKLLSELREVDFNFLKNNFDRYIDKLIKNQYLQPNILRGLVIPYQFV